ncbi:acetyltransferase [Gilvibacter sp.]|uniref:acetyltransferase n=1 Tax=Gilvibacter sp. TaxID=2729997 RepID=UPI0035BE568E
MKDIAIYGAGGFGREIAYLLEQINKVQPQYNLIGYYDDGVDPNTAVGELRVLGNISDLNAIDYQLCVVVAIGAPAIKKKVIEQINNPNLSFPNLFHPSVSWQLDTVKFGKGNIICAGNLLTVDIEIGDFVILNLSCTVGHDTVIKDYSSFMPSVNISGEVLIEEAVYVGTGAKIINQLTIGQNTIVGAGAVVSKDLPANCTAIGIPAKPFRYHNE